MHNDILLIILLLPFEMTYTFQDNIFLKKIYKEDLIKMRGEFLKKYTNRRFSLRDFMQNGYINDANLSILDIGCGNCSFLKKLKTIYPSNSYFGLDIVENREGVEFGEKSNYIIYDGIHYPKYKRKFDVILVMHTLYHVNDFLNFFSFIKEHNKESGYILITTKSVKTLNRIESIYTDIMKRLNIGVMSELRDESHFSGENGDTILNQYFSSYNIKKYIFENQIIVDNKDDLLKYVFSTQRYNPNNIPDLSKIDKYIKMREDVIDQESPFFDKTIEVLYVITK